MGMGVGMVRLALNRDEMGCMRDSDCCCFR